jgi:hypothetical protein
LRAKGVLLLGTPHSKSITPHKAQAMFHFFLTSWISPKNFEEKGEAFSNMKQPSWKERAFLFSKIASILLSKIPHLLMEEKFPRKVPYK